MLYLYTPQLGFLGSREILKNQRRFAQENIQSDRIGWFTCACWSSKFTRFRASSFSDRAAWQTNEKAYYSNCEINLRYNTIQSSNSHTIRTTIFCCTNSDNYNEMLTLFAIVKKHYSMHSLPVHSAARLPWLLRNPKLSGWLVPEMQRWTEANSPAPSEAPSLSGLGHHLSPTG